MREKRKTRRGFQLALLLPGRQMPTGAAVQHKPRDKTSPVSERVAFSTSLSFKSYWAISPSSPRRSHDFSPATLFCSHPPPGYSRPDRRLVSFPLPRFPTLFPRIYVCALPFSPAIFLLSIVFSCFPFCALKFVCLIRKLVFTLRFHDFKTVQRNEMCLFYIRSEGMIEGPLDFVMCTKTFAKFTGAL